MPGRSFGRSDGPGWHDEQGLPRQQWGMLLLRGWIALRNASVDAITSSLLARGFNSTLLCRVCPCMRYWTLVIPRIPV